MALRLSRSAHSQLPRRDYRASQRLLIGIFLLRYKRVGTVGQKDIGAAFRNMPTIDGATCGRRRADCVPVS